MSLLLRCEQTPWGSAPILGHYQPFMVINSITIAFVQKLLVGHVIDVSLCPLIHLIGVCTEGTLGPPSWGSAGEKRQTRRTFPMARLKCLTGNFPNLYRAYKAHQTNVWWTMKVFRQHCWGPRIHCPHVHESIQPTNEPTVTHNSLCFLPEASFCYIRFYICCIFPCRYVMCIPH